MNKLTKVCLVVFIISAVSLVIALSYKKGPATVKDCISKEYGSEHTDSIYQTIQTTIANYIVDNNIKTNSWVIKEKPKTKDSGLVFKVYIDDGSSLYVTYDNEKGECDVKKGEDS